MSLAASIIIRSYNEERWLGQLLDVIARQKTLGLDSEVILVDSGSVDRTVAIAEAKGCRIVHIPKADFTFGRSLNLGCEAARGEVLIFVSAHCIPVDTSWLQQMLMPFADDTAAYVYGRQIGHAITRFSERQIFAKYFPAAVEKAQGGVFCNNANAAIRRNVWREYHFDEELTGLEDMELASRLDRAGLQIKYVPSAPVYHIHQESWAKIRTRYEREAVALQKIMPEIHVQLLDFLRYFISGVLHDSGEALRQRALMREFYGIVMFRLMQYWGSYCGNNDHRRLSHLRKERYFYPK